MTEQIEDEFWAQERARDTAARGQHADPGGCDTCKASVAAGGQVKHDECAQRATLLPAPDAPGWELITGLSEEELAALPARFHVPAFIEPTRTWVCAVCWGDGWSTRWPCKTALEQGLRVFTAEDYAETAAKRQIAGVAKLEADLAEMTRCRDAALRALDRDDVEVDVHLPDLIADGLHGLAEWDSTEPPDQAPDWLINAIVALVRPVLAKTTEQRDRARRIAVALEQENAYQAAELAKCVGDGTGARITQYAVSALPEGDINAHVYEITVDYRGHGLWAVTRYRQCLSVDGEWDWEPIPSERDDDWLLTHRFDEKTALELAKQHAPHVVVNGITVGEALRRAEQRAAEAGER